MAPTPGQSDDALRQAIEDQLAQTRVGYSVTELARRVRSRDYNALTRVLLALQDKRLVRSTGGRWTWLGELRRPWRDIPKNRTRRRARVDSDLLSEPANRPATARADREEPAPPSTEGSRWDLFRRLCRYYAECVRISERSRISVLADRENSDYVAIPGALDWRALSAGEPVRVNLSPDSAIFVRRGVSGVRQPCWYVGAPVDVFRGKDRGTGGDWTALTPVLYVQVIPKPDESGIHLLPTGALEVNHGWLEKRFRRFEQRREFLATVGLTDAAVRDEDGDEYLHVATFRSAYEALRDGYADWWREYPNLDRLETSPALKELSENGLHNRAILVSQPKLQYSAKLFEELLRLADPGKVSDESLDRTALGTLFPHQAPSSVVGPPDPEGVDLGRAEYQALNEEQRQAVDAALAEPMTVLTGPPGTGKSVVVAHAMVNAALRHQSALFASKNHQAIEAVEPKLNSLVEPETLVMRPARPQGQQARQAEWQEAIVELLSRPRQPGASEELARQRTLLSEDLERRGELEGQLDRILELADALADVERDLRAAEHALDEGMRGRVATATGLPTLEDVDAAIRDLEAFERRADMPGWRRALGWLFDMVRGRRPGRSLRLRVDELLRRIDPEIGDPSPGQSATDRYLRPKLERLRAVRPFVLACETFGRATAIREDIESMPPRCELDQQLEEAEAAVQDRTRRTLVVLAETAGAGISPEQRQRFAELRAGLENHRGSLTESKFQTAFSRALPELLRHFPLWAVSNLSAYKASPLQPGAFDLLIVDEASQCDIASVVPLLYRARRFLAVGDPMQLRHVHQLPRQTEQLLRERFDLVDDTRVERFTYGVNSFYDLASSSAAIEGPLRLRAHYRCHPAIAAFCNESFYRRTLRVMTDAGRLKAIPGFHGTARGCAWTGVSGEIVPAASGCHCPAHLDAIVEELRGLEAAGFDGTVGIVTPFRAQADRVRDRVAAAFSADLLSRWRFVSGTVDAFQGDERDLVIFSLVGGDAMPQGSRIFLESSPNRFNVAVSRARSFLRVIGDRTWAATCSISFVTALLATCEKSEEQPFVQRRDLIGPVWEPRLADAMRAAGLTFFLQYYACGYYLDFALISEARRLDVEVDGETHHRGADGKRLVDDLYRDHVLRAAGWSVLRFWVYELREKMDECVARIRATWRDGAE